MLNTPATDLMMPRLLIRVSTESDMILPVTGRKDPTAIFNARLESESPAPVMAVCSESRPVKATVRIMIQRFTKVRRPRVIVFRPSFSVTAEAIPRQIYVPARGRRKLENSPPAYTVAL